MPYWSCDRRGDCCKEFAVVYVTADELLAINQAAPDVVLDARPLKDSAFIGIAAKPCPLLAEDGSCLVYDVRPYNCRRFVCLRSPDEPWIHGPNDTCMNLDRRLTGTGSYQAVAFYRAQERRHMPWALAHGWSKERTE